MYYILYIMYYILYIMYYILDIIDYISYIGSGPVVGVLRLHVFHMHAQQSWVWNRIRTDVRPAWWRSLLEALGSGAW